MFLGLMGVKQVALELDHACLLVVMIWPTTTLAILILAPARKPVATFSLADSPGHT